jgi:hypothetical protein
VQLSGHVTVVPQLLTAVPPHCVAQALPLSKQQLLAPTPPAPHTPPIPTHVSVQVIVTPQLFFVLPQAKPMHAMVAESGVQHVSPVTQTRPRSQLPHGIVMPHVTMFVSHTVLPQALASTEQHVPPSSHCALPEHVPQETGCPQLFVTIPQTWLPHVFIIESGLQPHVCSVVLQVPPSHPPQSIVLPQLSVTEPHRPSHHVAGGTGEQQLLPWQSPPSPQSHAIMSPHMSVTVTPHRFPHVTLGGGGEQQVPLSLSQTSLLCSQLAVPSTPQPTFCPQLFIFMPQFWMPQVTAVESGTHPPQLPAVHMTPPSHVPQLSIASQLSAVSPQRFSQ